MASAWASRRAGGSVSPKIAGLPGAEDARLLVADGFAVAAEECLVVEVHAHDDGGIGIDHVHRVEPPAQAHFEHPRVELRLLEDPERGERAELEVREGRVAARGLDTLEGSHERLIARLLALQAHALVVGEQVRGGVEADAVAGFDEDALEVGAGGPLAVGAADGEDCKRLPA